MNPIYMNDWKYIYSSDIKSGISLHFSNVHPYIKDWIMIYTKWLRNTYSFPVHIHTYCIYGRKLRCSDGSFAFGRIVEPEDRNKYPRIYIACGDFRPEREIDDDIRDETEMILYTFSHELIHYFQFINGMDMSARAVEWQASFYGKRLLHAFDSLYD